MAEPERKTGREFDLAYVAGQIAAHQKTATLRQYEISFRKNQALQKYAADALPKVLERLESAKQQCAILTSTVGPR